MSSLSVRGRMQSLAQPGALHARQQLVPDVGEIIDIVDHAERQTVETGTVQALERFDGIVVAADAGKARAADQAFLEPVRVGLEPGVDGRRLNA